MLFGGASEGSGPLHTISIATMVVSSSGSSSAAMRPYRSINLRKDLVQRRSAGSHPDHVVAPCDERLAPGGERVHPPVGVNEEGSPA
jgi:hypothetical protein